MLEGTYVHPALFLVRSGKISVKSKLQKIAQGVAGAFGHTIDGGSGEAYISSGGYFGADMLHNVDEQGELSFSKYTIKAEEKCVVGVLTLKTIWSVVGGRVTEGELKVDELTKHRLLGAGTFGRVYMVSKPSTNTKAYALKIQEKRALIDYGMVKGVLNERNIMIRLNHPFIIRLVSSCQDDPNIYMLMELYQGGELRTLVQYAEYGLPEQTAVFYAAGILEGLHFMNSRRIVHRDLKPGTFHYSLLMVDRLYASVFLRRDHAPNFFVFSHQKTC